MLNPDEYLRILFTVSLVCKASVVLGMWVIYECLNQSLGLETSLGHLSPSPGPNMADSLHAWNRQDKKKPPEIYGRVPPTHLNVLKFDKT